MAGSNGTLSQNEGHADSQEDLLLFFVPALFLIQKGCLPVHGQCSHAWVCLNVKIMAPVS